MHAPAAPFQSDGTSWRSREGPPVRGRRLRNEPPTKVATTEEEEEATATARWHRRSVAVQCQQSWGLDVVSSIATRSLVQPVRSRGFVETGGRSLAAPEIGRYLRGRPAERQGSSAGAGHGTRRAQPRGMESWITRSRCRHAPYHTRPVGHTQRRKPPPAPKTTSITVASSRCATSGRGGGRTDRPAATSSTRSGILDDPPANFILPLDMDPFTISQTLLARCKYIIYVLGIYIINSGGRIRLRMAIGLG